MDKPDLNRMFHLNEPPKPGYHWFSYAVWATSGGTADGGIDPLGNVIMDDPAAWVAVAPQITARVQSVCNSGDVQAVPYEMISYVLMAEIARLRLLLQQSAEDAARGEG